MKKIKSLIMALFVAFLATFQAFAFADVRVFNNSSGDGFENFQKYLEKEGVLHNGVFPTNVLSKLAYKLAEENGYLELVPEEMRSPERYEGIFLARNNLGATITVDQFRAQGQGAFFWLPKIQAKEAGKAVSAPSQVATMDGASVDPKELQAMNQRLEKLSKEIIRVTAASRDADTKLADQATKRMGEIGTEIESIKKQLDRYAQKASTDKVAGDVAKLQSTIDDLDTQIKSVQGSPILKFGNVVIVAVGALGALVLLALGLGVFNHRRITLVKKGVISAKAEVAEIQSKVAGNAQAIAEVDERVTGLENELFPGNTLAMSKSDAALLVGKLSSLPVSEEYVQLCRLEDGTQYRVLFTRQMGEYVTIKGIADQQEKNQVGIRNVPTRLRLAAKKGQFTDRWMIKAVA